MTFKYKIETFGSKPRTKTTNILLLNNASLNYFLWQGWCKVQKAVSQGGGTWLQKGVLQEAEGWRISSHVVDWMMRVDKLEGEYPNIPSDGYKSVQCGLLKKFKI